MALVDARLRIGSKMLLALSYGGTRKANGFTHTALDSFVNVVSQIGSHHLSSLHSALSTIQTHPKLNKRE